MANQKSKWPKTLPPITEKQAEISDDWMEYWHKVSIFSPGINLVEKFNHGYVIDHAPENFLTTLEIGAGTGNHLLREKLSPLQKENYVVCELRKNMAEALKLKHPEIQVILQDCQTKIPFDDDHFDRILAIHILEHLPNLPEAIKEMHRLCNKKKGVVSVVIPCEGGKLYGLARAISSKKIFEKRYHMPYKWLMDREHINRPHEIIEELSQYFVISNKRYFPSYIPSVNCNLCIGLTMHPKQAKK